MPSILINLHPQSLHLALKRWRNRVQNHHSVTKTTVDRFSPLLIPSESSVQREDGSPSIYTPDFTTSTTLSRHIVITGDIAVYGDLHKKIQILRNLHLRYCYRLRIAYTTPSSTSIPSSVNSKIQLAYSQLHVRLFQ